MFNDDYIKLESHLLVIDVMIKSLDNILEIIREKDINEEKINELLTKIFAFCEKIIEILPSFAVTPSISKQQLLNSVSIVQKYWNENDLTLFTLNWFLFVAQWNDFSDNMKKTLILDSSRNFFSMN